MLVGKPSVPLLLRVVVELQEWTAGPRRKTQGRCTQQSQGTLRGPCTGSTVFSGQRVGREATWKHSCLAREQKPSGGSVTQGPGRAVVV